MQDPLFDQLRTKEKFGYEVDVSLMWTYGIMVMSFYVLKSRKCAEEVGKQLDQFLLDFRDKFIAMEEESFLEHVIGLAKNKLQIFNSLKEECNNLWYEISENRYNWEWYQDKDVYLQSVNKESIIAAFGEWLLPHSALT